MATRNVVAKGKNVSKWALDLTSRFVRLMISSRIVAPNTPGLFHPLIQFRCCFGPGISINVKYVHVTTFFFILTEFGIEVISMLFLRGKM